MTNEEILKKVQAFVKKHGVDATVIIQDPTDENYSVAEYDRELKQFNIYVDSIRSGAEKYGVSIDDFIKILMSHELGHYFDTQLDFWMSFVTKAINKIKEDGYSLSSHAEIICYTNQVEERAWELGKQYLPNKKLLKKYDEWNKDNIQNSEKHSEINVYKLKHYNEQRKLLLQCRDLAQKCDELENEIEQLKADKNNIYDMDYRTLRKLYDEIFNRLTAMLQDEKTRV